MIEITEDVLMTPVEVTVITEEEDTEEKTKHTGRSA